MEINEGEQRRSPLAIPPAIWVPRYGYAYVQLTSQQSTVSYTGSSSGGVRESVADVRSPLVGCVNLVTV